MDKVQTNLPDKFRSAIDWINLDHLHNGVIVGLSGGPDSICLCDLMLRISSEINFPVHAAHLNHGLRGHESDADEVFAVSFCKDMGIELTVEQLRLSDEVGQSELSLEMLARKSRYDFFGRLSAELGMNILALGHNADDRVENLLMRLFRGAGGRGLGSLRPIRNHGHLTVIRPLLTAFRSEILEYLTNRKIEYRTDRTNLETDTDRGRLRNFVIPRLTDLCLESGLPDPTEALARSAELIADDEAMLQEIMDIHSMFIETGESEEIRFNRPGLKDVPEPILGRLVLSAIEHSHDTVRPERVHVEAIIDMIRGTSGGPVDIPGKLTARVSGDWVTIGCPSEKEQPEPVEIRISDFPLDIEYGPFSLKFSIKNILNDRTFTDKVLSQNGTVITLHPQLDSLVIRPAGVGDRIDPLGMCGHSKKLSDILIDVKVPAADRNSHPVIVNATDGEILSLPSLGIISERWKITRKTDLIIMIELSHSQLA